MIIVVWSGAWLPFDFYQRDGPDTTEASLKAIADAENMWLVVLSAVSGLDASKSPDRRPSKENCFDDQID